jgi:hypothetical protein
MVAPSKTFRVFVSSPFGDLHAERDALNREVFPRLSALCQSYGARFQAVDLRWGVSQAASEDQQTMRVCFSEIDRCRAVTHRPNFIVLLGDRYGWRPAPEEIPATEYDQIQALLRSTGAASESARLDQWYRQDSNAAQAVFRLLPRHIDYAGWLSTERELCAILRRAVADIPLTPEQRLKYTASATEQEIAHWGLFEAGDDEQVFCFFRQVENLPQDGRARGYVDLDDRDQPDIEARARLDDLKQRLRTRMVGRVREFRATWDGSSPSTDHLDPLCRDVYAYLADVIVAEASPTQAMDPLDAEIGAHQAFAEDRRRYFVGRADILAAIRGYAVNPTGHPLAIVGPSGSGKSAVMARAAADVAGARPELALIHRFIGATPESSDIRALLQSLCRQIARVHGADETTVPTDYRLLVSDFRDRLALATEQQPLIVFLDALDQLTAAHHGHDLTWLPDDLPPHVSLVVSTQTGSWHETLNRVAPQVALLPLEPLHVSDGEVLLDLWLDDAGRKLTPAQRERVLRAFAANGLPLYLRLAFEQARHWQSFDPAVDLESTVPGLIRALFSRLSDDASHGPVLVARSLAYLAAAKNGLSHEELLDVLSRDDDVLTDFRVRSPLSPPVPEGDTLPVVMWSRLYFDLRPYFTERAADGTATLDFFHRQLRAVVERDYLPGQVRKQRHQKLAEYFLRQSHRAEPGGKARAPDLRELSESPFQLAHAELWHTFDQLLGDFEFLQAKISAVGPQPAIDDFDLPFAPDPQDSIRRSIGSTRHLQATQDALRLATQVLARDPGQLAGQLRGRLAPTEEPALQRLAALARAHVAPPAIVPRHPSLRGPGPLVFRLAGHSGDVTAVAFTADGSRAISGSRDGTLRVWDLRTGLELQRFHQFWWEHQTAITLSQDGRRALIAYEHIGIRGMHYWDLERGMPLLQQEWPSKVTSLAMTSDYTGVVFGTEARRSTSRSADRGSPRPSPSPLTTSTCWQAARTERSACGSGARRTAHARSSCTMGRLSRST